MPKLKLQEIDQIKSATLDQQKLLRETRRGEIAFWYVIGFLLIVVIAIIIGSYLVYESKITFNDLTQMIITISGVLSGALGFIIGYYFKSSD